MYNNANDAYFLPEITDFGQKYITVATSKLIPYYYIAPPGKIASYNYFIGISMGVAN